MQTRLGRLAVPAMCVLLGCQGQGAGQVKALCLEGWAGEGRENGRSGQLRVLERVSWQIEGHDVHVYVCVPGYLKSSQEMKLKDKVYFGTKHFEIHALRCLQKVSEKVYEL